MENVRNFEKIILQDCKVFSKILITREKMKAGGYMLVLVTYDVSTQDAAGRGRLRKVAKECVNYGQRVQNSVFECILDASQLLLLKDRLSSLIDEEKDSLRFYYLGNNYKTKVEHFGCKNSYEPEGVLII